MLQRLAGGERSIGELAEPHAMSFAGASKHVRVLKGRGWCAGMSSVAHTAAVSRRRASARRTPGCALIERFWTSRLDVLDALLRQEAEQHKSGQGEKS